MELTKSQRTFLRILLRSTYESKNYLRDFNYAPSDLYREMEEKGIKTRLKNVNEFSSSQDGLDLLNAQISALSRDLAVYIVNLGFDALQQVVDHKLSELEGEMEELQEYKALTEEEGGDTSIIDSYIARLQRKLNEMRALNPKKDLKCGPGYFSLENKPIYQAYFA